MKLGVKKVRRVSKEKEKNIRFLVEKVTILPNLPKGKVGVITIMLMPIQSL